MKRIISFAAAIAALFTVSSCEDFINSMLNNYMIGSNVVFVDKAEVMRVNGKDNSSSGYIFNFYEKQDGDTDGYAASAALVINNLDYEKALKGKTPVGDIAFGGYSADGKVQLGYVNSTLATFSGLEKEYDSRPVVFDGTIRIIEGSEGTVSITLRAALTLKVKGSDETENFDMWLTYNGTPEDRGTIAQ